MTTNKATESKATESAKKTTVRKSAKIVKKAAKKGLDETRKIKAIAGNENHFYKGFPRGLAYALLLKAPKKTLLVSTFLAKVEKLAGVKSKKQARGIVTKMINKPGDDGIRNGQVAHYV